MVLQRDHDSLKEWAPPTRPPTPSQRLEPRHPRLLDRKDPAAKAMALTSPGEGATAGGAQCAASWRRFGASLKEPGATGATGR